MKDLLKDFWPYFYQELKNNNNKAAKMIQRSYLRPACSIGFDQQDWTRRDLSSVIVWIMPGFCES